MSPHYTYHRNEQVKNKGIITDREMFCKKNHYSLEDMASCEDLFEDEVV